MKDQSDDKQLTHEEQNLIQRCFELMNDLIDDEPPGWRVWEHRQWLEQREFGPRYLVSDWFGPLRERDRVRYRRAIDSLEARGLLKTHRLWGTRLTHISLTSQGIALAQRLESEAATNG